MASNNAILIDNIICDLMTEYGAEQNDRTRGRFFDVFAFSELLKTYDLTQEQIEDGITDGGDDVGIDGFYTFVNGLYLHDSVAFQWPRQQANL
ncbi:MAG: hypothetical protein FWF81_00815 [Defluviitaleaceae bacterium]|nr:hypothetical protein [Defluviitaleaceae bacterium]